MHDLKQDAPDTDRTRQVVNHIRALLEKGALQPGDRITPDESWPVPSKSAAQAAHPLP
jgi:hypothetical protein